MRFKMTKQHQALLKKYNTGNDIYVLLGPNKYMKTQISAIQSLVVQDEKKENLYNIFPQKIYITHIVFDNNYFSKENNAVDFFFPFSQVRLTESEAQEAVRYVKVDNISDSEWLEAIGDRDIEESIEYCILQPCCATISSIRDILFKCKKNSGLTVCEIKDLQSLCWGHEALMIPKENSLQKILDLLGVKWEDSDEIPVSINNPPAQ